MFCEFIRQMRIETLPRNLRAEDVCEGLGDKAMLRRRENGKYVVLTVRHTRIYSHHKLDEQIYLVN